MLTNPVASVAFVVTLPYSEIPSAPFIVTFFILLVIVPAVTVRFGFTPLDVSSVTVSELVPATPYWFTIGPFEFTVRFTPLAARLIPAVANVIADVLRFVNVVAPFTTMLLPLAAVKLVAPLKVCTVALEPKIT
jgi:hypothetical protein